MEFDKKLFTEFVSEVEAFCVKKYGQNLCNCLIAKDLEKQGGEMDLFLNLDPYGIGNLEISVVYVLGTGTEAQQKSSLVFIPGLINDLRTKSKKKVVENLKLFVSARISSLLGEIRLDFHAYKLTKEKGEQEATAMRKA